ncbi:Folate-biopterin transporter [Acaryochloris thomasi RCC1774]|uniref:Folate-biopterin transporter n=1 Tax=Acaryochloris thomasi RCC1774 TaxID=1764569 RepID=A0A2W1JJ04_9CYAN|nr:folate/biopterin family MFS transporter [Acaryochloris thomasi]PZD73450.1 Folate-biopterin transporter [Acaryochloris thomasi RCC1774]
MINSQASAASLKQTLKRTIFFDQDPSPELFAILAVYFVQGILGLARLGVSFFLKDDLGLSPAAVAAMMGIASLPWVVKPLFGFLSDSLPILGYRRRSYLVLSGILGCLAWVAMGTVVNSAVAATVAIATTSTSTAISDVIADSIVVERIRQESQSDAGSLQSLCWGTTALGGVVTAYFSGWLLEHLSTRSLFLITATFPLIVCAIASLIIEAKANTPPSFKTAKHQIVQVKDAIAQPSILLPVLFVFLWQATPNSESAFFFFTTNELGFNPEFLGRVRLVTSLASLFGIWLFQRFFKAVAMRTIFLWTTLLSSALGMTTLLLVTHANRTLGIDDHWFSLGDSLILTVMGQLAYMPVLVLAARLCPAGIEATMFALLMSIINLAGILSHESGALLMHQLGVTESQFQNLWLLVMITNLSTLLPLPLLRWLPKAEPDSQDSLDLATLKVPPSQQGEIESTVPLSP